MKTKMKNKKPKIKVSELRKIILSSNTRSPFVAVVENGKLTYLRIR